MIGNSTYKEIFKKVEKECLDRGRILTTVEIEDIFSLDTSISRCIQPELRQKNPELPFFLQKAGREKFDIENGNNTEAKVRKCLCCKKEFHSSWAGDRVCYGCKSQERWRDYGYAI